MYSYRDTRFLTDEIRVKFTDKTEIVKCFHFESVKSFFQSNQK